ncbi:MAG: hypothetical protein HQK51_05855 [Oligoflexia bacterium]|nr:hypothetical protein [Oligoflexia bacterium]
MRRGITIDCWKNHPYLLKIFNEWKKSTSNPSAEFNAENLYQAFAARRKFIAAEFSKITSIEEMKSLKEKYKDDPLLESVIENIILAVKDTHEKMRIASTKKSDLIADTHKLMGRKFMSGPTFRKNYFTSITAMPMPTISCGTKSLLSTLVASLVKNTKTILRHLPK